MALEFVLFVDQERLDKVDFDHLTGVQKLTKKGLEELGGNVLGAPGGLLSPTLRTVNVGPPHTCELTSFAMVSHVSDDLASIDGVQRNMSWDGPVTRFDPAEGNHINYPVELPAVVAAPAYTNYIWAAPVKNDEDNDTRRVWDVVTGDEVAQNINTRGRSRLEFRVGETNPFSAAEGGAPIVRLNIDASGNVESSSCISAWDNEELHSYLFEDESGTGGTWSDPWLTTQVGWLLENLGGTGSNTLATINNIAAESAQQDRHAGVVALLQIIRFQLHRILGRGLNDAAKTLGNANGGLYPWSAKPQRSIADIYENQEDHAASLSLLDAFYAPSSVLPVPFATAVLVFTATGGAGSVTMYHQRGIARIDVSGSGAGAPVLVFEALDRNGASTGSYRPVGFSASLIKAGTATTPADPDHLLSLTVAADLYPDPLSGISTVPPPTLSTSYDSSNIPVLGVGEFGMQLTLVSGVNSGPPNAYETDVLSSLAAAKYAFSVTVFAYKEF